MRWLTITSLLVLLAGCSNLSLSDLATGTGSVVGAGVGSLTGNPAVVMTTAGAGALVGASLVGEDETQVEVLEAIPEDQRADVAKTQAFWSFVEHFLEWIVGATVGLIALAWILPSPQSLLFWRKSTKSSG